MKILAHIIACLWLSCSWSFAGFILTPYRFASGGDPSFANVSLLLHCNGTNASTTFTDNSPVGHTVTANGDAQLSTGTYKFATASGAFDGTGDYLSVPAHSSLDFGTGDFTIEMWVFFNATGTQYLMDLSTVITSAISITPSTGNLFVYSDGSFCVNGGSTVFNTGQWYHIALSRSGGTWTVYRDGTQYLQATGQTSRTFGSSSLNLYLGIAGNLTLGLNGNLDDIRMTKGVSRYNSNFTPHTTQHPDS